jgi:biopolymer transport protein ExbD
MTTLLPAESSDSTFVAESGSVTLVAGADGLAYYQGLDAGKAEIIPWTETDALRIRLIRLQRNLQKNEGNDDKLFVMIKPTEQASFARVVQVLDEMKICQMKRYTLADLSPEEILLFGRL